MAILTGVGASTNTDAEQAAHEAFQLASQPLEGNPASFLLVYATAFAYKDDILLAALKKLAPNAVIVGGSSSGEITSSHGVTENSVAVMALYSDTIKFTPVITKDVPGAGKTLVDELLKVNPEKPKAALVIHDAMQGHGVSLVDGLVQALGPECQLVGAGASDNFATKETHQFFAGQVYTGHVLLVGMYGDFRCGVGAKHGWSPVSERHVITKAEKNIIHEIDNKPAAEMYREYLSLGAEATYQEINDKGRYYPIGIPSAKEGEYLIRNFAQTMDDGSLVFSCEMPGAGVELFLTMAGKDECFKAAEDSARHALVGLENKSVKAALLFDCITRKAMLVNSAQEEIDRIRAIIGNDVPLIGFYSYGEVGRQSKDSTSTYNNEAAVLFLLAE